jgi:hypothetical protein
MLVGGRAAREAEGVRLLGAPVIGPPVADGQGIRPEVCKAIQDVWKDVAPARSKSDTGSALSRASAARERFRPDVVDPTRFIPHAGGQQETLLDLYKQAPVVASPVGRRFIPGRGQHTSCYQLSGNDFRNVIERTGISPT